MAGLAWVMMGIAIWHFTVFLPDRFWAGIVGAFVGATLGAVRAPDADPSELYMKDDGNGKRQRKQKNRKHGRPR